MSRLEIPLAYRTLRTTGDVVVRAELDLELKTDQGTWETAECHEDSGKVALLNGL
jgi:hypothetical protein